MEKKIKMEKTDEKKPLTSNKSAVRFIIHEKKLKEILYKAPFVTEKQDRKWIPPNLKEEVRKRDKYKCVVCERAKNLKVHHVIPYGDSTLDNLVTTCEICHEYIHKILKRKGYPYVSPLIAMQIRNRFR